MRAIYPSVVEAMRGSDEPHDVGGAIVNYRTRKSYKFSEKIRSLAEERKIRKTLEIQTGVAEVEPETEIIFVRFKKAESRQD